MKILYISTNFPEKSKGDSIYTDLANAIHSFGHDIDVFVCDGRKKTLVEFERGYRTVRVASSNYFTKNIILKGFSFFRLPFFMKKAIKKYNSKTYDLILFEAPPISYASICNWASRKFNSTIFLMQKDFFPENLKDLEIIKEKSLLYRIFRRIEKKCFKCSDFIGVMSEQNLDFLISNNKFLPKYKCLVFQNTINPTISINNSLINENIRKLTHNKFVVGDIGNFGKPQSVPLLMTVICNLKPNNDIFFILAGRGSELGYIEKFVLDNNLTNTLLIKNPGRELSDSLTSVCDIGLITIDHRFSVPNFPSRCLSYMKFSKPIVASTDVNTDFGYYVTDVYKCGVWSESKTPDYISQNILFLKNDVELRKKLGKNGNNYLRSHLSCESSLSILNNLIFEKDDIKIKLIKDIRTSREIASIHIDCFDGFFLTKLGRHFLTQFYKNYIKSDNSGIYGAYCKDRLVGFLSFTSSNERIATKTVLSRPLSIGLPLFLKMIFSKKIRIGLRASVSNTIHFNNHIYISSLAVKSLYRNKKIGSMLINQTIINLSNNISGFYVLTDFSNNKVANDFYYHNGFELYDTIKREDERMLNIFVYNIKKS